jgi:hypothetical protein
MRPGRSVPLSSASTYGDEVGGGLDKWHPIHARLFTVPTSLYASNRPPALYSP